MILNIQNDELSLQYIIRKRFDNETRLQKQAEYQFGPEAGLAMHISSYDSPLKGFSLNFEQLHLH